MIGSANYRQRASDAELCARALSIIAERDRQLELARQWSALADAAEAKERNGMPAA